MLPNGFNVFPEDIENALRVAGIRDSVAVETRARADRGDRARRRATHRPPSGATRHAGDRADRPGGCGATIDAAVKAANAALGPNQRIAGWRLWPEADFPRTHTLKVKRDQVRAWATDEAPLPVTEGATASG